MFRSLIAAIGLLQMLMLAPVYGQTSDESALRADIARLAGADFNGVESVVQSLAATGDPAVAPLLRALRGGDVYWRKSDNLIVIGEKEKGRKLRLSDPLSGTEIEVVKSRETKKVKVNNTLRNVIDVALGALTLRAKDPDIRLSAAEQMFSRPDPAALNALDAALAAEADETVRTAMLDARAAMILKSPDADTEDAQAAIARMVERGDSDARNTLASVKSEDTAVTTLVADGIDKIDYNLKLWSYGQNVWQGISLGSVLLLAAIGLAITFGVMGVINMAHGELVMIGAYTTFFVQEMIRAYAPGMFDMSLFIAAPLAFLTAGFIGICIERGVVRFLYGRPLETLLATWGVSLILQQAVRSIFGPNNREVGNPSFMSGAFELGGLTITWNRLWILIFALAIFVFLLFVMKRTMLGLQMRAVTQNRAMAADMGIRTGWVDAMTFGLGAGIAGLAGVALSQIDNVSPNLGQSYIVDSFMVVVFGGAGNLWGALAGAFTLGIANKFLEPFSGAVLAKVLVLIFIILFIQKRPRGLFALKGRAVDA
jgi:urea transport system permease protein